jgi:hypothetical protein
MLVDPTTLDFRTSGLYRKTATLPLCNVTVAVGGESVITMQTAQDGSRYVETTNTAESGDRIITRSDDDRYIIKASKFDGLYEIDPTNPLQYRSKNTGRAIFLTEDTDIQAPWGELQHIKAGGVVFQASNGDVYGNQAHSFEADFDREAADGSLCHLSLPLKQQGDWALRRVALRHYDDVVWRMAFATQSTPRQPHT